MFLAGTAIAQSPITLTISNSAGHAIPADYGGVSFGAVAELPDHGGVIGHLFSPTNTQLITLFKNSGLHHLRLGGSTVEGTNAAVPDHEAIDNVFTFARAADAKVIYSLRLLNGDPAVAAADAKYIWEHHRQMLDSFAIGNEPDINRYQYPPYGTGSDPAITNYSSFLAAWRKFAAAVTNAVPGAKFAGPDAANRTYAKQFARDEKNSGLISIITTHFYVGGRPYITKDGPEKIPISEAISNMLSPEWVAKKYPGLYQSVAAPVLAQGLPYRLTESDDYLKGIEGASDAFASALWALDYLHWWAAHDCDGVNFHNTEWLKTDTVYLAKDGSYQINPKAYALKAFEIAARGRVQPLTMLNTNSLNLTAYAVGDATTLCVTIINKEHGANAREAIVKIAPQTFSSGNVSTMFLQSPNNDPAAMTGITLGGATITNDAPWFGQWKPSPPFARGQCTITVSPASAALIKISSR